MDKIEKALSFLRSLEHPKGGIRAWPDGSQYIECTGYTIPTLLRYGEDAYALRCAEWLLSTQRSDGAWPGFNGGPTLFDTAAVVEGLMAIKGNDKEVASMRAIQWMRSVIAPDGTMVNKNSKQNCYLMRASAIIGDFAAADYWMPRLEALTKERTHYIAYCLEGLWLAGKHEFVIEWLDKARKLEKGGIMPYLWNGAGTDFCATSQFAVLRSWAGLDFDIELKAVTDRMKGNGGIPLAADSSVQPIWAQKFYLDACAEATMPDKRHKRTVNRLAVIVGIDHWEDITLPFVKSLQKYNPTLPILIVDNASDKPYPRVKGTKRLRLPERVGYNLAMNAAIEAHPGKDWYILFNNDCLCTGDFALNFAFMKDDTVYGSGWNDNKCNKTNDLQVQWSAWLCLSKKVIQTVGLFDPILTGAFEDFDYQLQARQAGYKIDTLALPVNHLDAHTRYDEVDYRERWHASRDYFYKKWSLKAPGKKIVTKRAWLIGNAPSIANLNMSKLRHEVTFSFNRAYIAYKDWGWYPTYYIVNDANIIRQCAEDINALIDSRKIKAFYLNKNGSENIKTAKNVHLIEFDEARNNWGFDPVNFKYCGDVAAFALQVAYSLGYRDVYMAGVDQNWGTHGKSIPDADTDHFRSDYETENVRMSKIYATSHLKSWKKSIKEATADPYNMTITVTTDSKLKEVLPFVPFEAAI